MAKPNYSFEKRQRELAKKKKKEEKEAEKRARKAGAPGAGDAPGGADEPGVQPDADAAQASGDEAPDSPDAGETEERTSVERQQP